MKKKLMEAVQNNSELQIKILYGIKDINSHGQIRDKKQIMESRNFIKQLQEVLGDALQIQETNTHDKVIIVDDKEFMLGSANVLSFTGNYRNNPRLHSEIAIYSKNKKQLLELKEKFFNW